MFDTVYFGDSFWTRKKLKHVKIVKIGQICAVIFLKI